MQLSRLAASLLISVIAPVQGAGPLFLHTAGPPSDQTRVVQEQVVVLKSSHGSLENDKQTLSKSMAKLKRTRSSKSTAKLKRTRSSEEIKCVREREVLKKTLIQTLERANETGIIAEQLASQSMRLRTKEFEAKRSLNKLQHTMAGSRFEQVHLKESVEKLLGKDGSEFVISSNQSIPEMVDVAVSFLRAQNTELHNMTEQLQSQNVVLRTEEADTKKQVNKLQQSMAASLFDQEHLKQLVQELLRKDGSGLAISTNQSMPEMVVGVVATLRAQGAELHSMDSDLKAAQLEVASLKGRVVALEDHRRRLVVAQQTSAAEGEIMRKELAQMRKERDEATQKMQVELTSRAKMEGAVHSRPPLAEANGAVAPIAAETVVVGHVSNSRSADTIPKTEPAESRPPLAEPNGASAPIATATKPSAQPTETAVAGRDSSSGSADIPKRSENATMRHLDVEETGAHWQAATRHRNIRKMKTLAKAMRRRDVEKPKAIAESADPLGAPLSAWEVALAPPEAVAAAAEPPRHVSWLGARSDSKVASLSPDDLDRVDRLDQEALTNSRTSDEDGDAEEGSSVAQVLRRAQAVVSEAAAAE